MLSYLQKNGLYAHLWLQHRKRYANRPNAMSNSNLFIDNEVHIWIGNLQTIPCLSKAKSRMHILNNDEISSLFDHQLL